MSRLRSVLALITLSAALVACSGASAAPATGTPNPSTAASDGITIVAKDIRFTTQQVTAKAAHAFAITFDNQDDAPHDIAISDASGAKVFHGDIVSKTTITYQVPALAAGTYTFICEVHPDMKGTLTVD